MKSQLFKLNFISSVHFGDGGLMKAKSTLSADTVFSALCIEALKRDQKTFECLVRGVKSDRIRISDGLPYIGDLYYIPKPLVHLEQEQQGDSSVKKAIKKLEYIPVQYLEEYVKGDLDIKKHSKYFHDAFGAYRLGEKAAVSGMEESMPYSVAVFQYCDRSGLYLCVQYEMQEDLELVEELLLELSLTGIGGKRSSGYGRFELKYGKMPPEFEKHLTGSSYARYMTLSIAIPDDDEIYSTLNGAGYRLIRRAGFVDSTTYSETFRKKRDVYLMVPGSVFRERFSGKLLDVSSGGAHPVYRYAKPIWLGVM